MSNQNIINLSRWGEFLGSRELGTEIRTEVNTLLSDSPNVIINFDGIQMISHSFTDELIGKLVSELSPDVFKERIKLKNVVLDINPIIRYVVANHLNK